MRGKRWINNECSSRARAKTQMSVQGDREQVGMPVLRDCQIAVSLLGTEAGGSLNGSQVIHNQAKLISEMPFQVPSLMPFITGKCSFIHELVMCKFQQYILGTLQAFFFFLASIIKTVMKILECVVW